MAKEIVNEAICLSLTIDSIDGSLSFSAGDKLSFEVHNGDNTTPVISTWEYTFTATDFSTFPESSLPVIIDGVWQALSDAGTAAPLLSNLQGTNNYPVLLIDGLATLAETTPAVTVSLKTGTTINWSTNYNAVASKMAIGLPLTAVNVENNAGRNFVLGGLVGYVINQAITNEQILATNA